MGKAEMMEGRKPFELIGDRKESVLCLHGFTGSPGNYRKLARLLHGDGYTVSVPVLPGHGTEPADMVGVSEQDWLLAAENAYLKLRADSETVHVVGLSLGGALAAKLASLHPEITSLTLLAPAFRINPFIAERLGIAPGEYDRNRGAGEMAAGESQETTPAPTMIPLPARQPGNDEMDECIFGYASFPASAAKALHMAGAMAWDSCPLINVPTCLIYTAADMVVDPAACEEMAGRIPGMQKVVRLEKSEHNVLLGNDRMEVYRLVHQFLRT